jgi:hypothetical protein
MILSPIPFVAAMDIDGDTILISPHHPLNVILFKGPNNNNNNNNNNN